MAALTFDHEALHLTLTGGEKLAALHGDIDVPLGDVRGVRLEPDPLAAVRGLRAPGLGLPGRVKIGTWRGPDQRSFVVARRGVPAVRVQLANAKHDELLVSTPEAERIVAALGDRLAA
jgi:uncharacterized protein